MKRLTQILLSLLLVVAFFITSKGVVFRHCLCLNHYTLVVGTAKDCCKKNQPCMETVVEQVSPSCAASYMSFAFDNPFGFIGEPVSFCGWSPSPVLNYRSKQLLVAVDFSPPPRAYLAKICLLQI